VLESRAQVLPRASSRQQYDELYVVDKARAPMLVFFLCFELGIACMYDLVAIPIFIGILGDRITKPSYSQVGTQNGAS